MSFGWSVGDIVAALKLLHQVGLALKDSGGASLDFQDTYSFLQTLSRTLQHLNALQYTSLDPDIAEHLREQCDHIWTPLEAFLGDMKSRFAVPLGQSSPRHSILTAARKIQWALSTSKKLRKLQERVAIPLAAVSIILGQQVVQTTLQMPAEIQDRLARVLNEAVGMKISSETIMVHKKIEDISAIQATSTDMIAHTIKDVAKSMIAQIDVIAIQGAESTSRLEHSLHTKFGQVEASIEAIGSVLQNLSTAPSSKGLTIPSSDLEVAIGSMLSSIWLLISNLQCLVRELLILLAPYLTAFYKHSIHHLLQYGDHFLFEDAIGRVKRLPCAQFQFWSTFQEFLLDSFTNTPGLSFIVGQRFVVMNGYNNYPIDPTSWQAVIQPKSKVTMSILLEGLQDKARCPDLSCSGRLINMLVKTAWVCPICRKHISILKTPLLTTEGKSEEDSEDLEQKNNFGDLEGPQAPRNNEIINGQVDSLWTNEIAAFKRVTWQEHSDPVLHLQSINGTFERKSLLLPYFPDTLTIGRQWDPTPVATPSNGIFKSEVLSRRHAQIWADRNGRVWIRDTKSANGTFVNGTRLSGENRESEPHELQTGDYVELDIDIVFEGQTIHHKVAVRDEYARYPGPNVRRSRMPQTSWPKPTVLP